MRKIFLILLVLLTFNCFTQTNFDGYVWINMTPDMRVSYVVNIVAAAKELSIQVDVEKKVKEVCDTIIKGVEGKTSKDVVDYINSFYRDKEELSISIVEVIYKYAILELEEII